MTPEQYIQLGGAILIAAIMADLLKWGIKWLLQDRVEKQGKTDEAQSRYIKELEREVGQNSKNIALVLQSINKIETNDLWHLKKDSEENRKEHKEIMRELTTIITILKNK